MRWSTLSSVRPTHLLVCLVLLGCGSGDASHLELKWGGLQDRPWAGADLWANRLQDWEVRSERLTVRANLPMRTVSILTRRGLPSQGGLTLRARLGLLPSADGPGNSGTAIGFLLGAGGEGMDPRRAALIHHSPGPGGGVFVGVDEGGFLQIADFSRNMEVLARSEEAVASTESLTLTVEIRGGEGAGALLMTATPLSSPGSAVTLELPLPSLDPVTGGLALAFHGNAESEVLGWFQEIELDGPGLEVVAGGELGPVLGAQHILDRGEMRLLAQLFPVSGPADGSGEPSPDSVRMDIRGEEGGWEPVATKAVVVPGYTALFTDEAWPQDRDVPYRLTFVPGPGRGDPGATYEGTIRAEPLKVEEMVVAAFTGNHNVASPGVDRGDFNWEDHLWFPHEDVVTRVRAHDPDFLFFSGDQIYEGASPTRADFDNPYGDYLYKWYLWLWAYRDLTREIPSVAVPDDHDVFHGNVWGAGGRLTPPGLSGASAQDQGGYKLPAKWVNMVQRTQAGHLPPTPGAETSDAGIESYYSDILYGGVSFAVLEDRKFKSPPKLLVLEADVWNGWAQNPAFHAPTGADAPGASLLGSNQEEFLEEWAGDWSGGTWMKVVLSQTIFNNVATIPADAMSGSVIPSLPIPEPGAWVEGDKMAADMDSNGWPQSGRNRAVRAMRKGFAVHLAGDQHLASTIQYGVDEWGDAGFALCVPSVANFWPRRWYPPTPGGNRPADAPRYAGDFRDGFGNLMTVHAVSNPALWGHEPEVLHNRAPGYGIARFNRTTRKVTLEAWPRWADPKAGDPPYPGWPVRFQQIDGYGKEPVGFLPTLRVEGMENPVVQVVSEAGGEILYTLRIQGREFTPAVFEPGSYSIAVGEPGTDRWRIFLGQIGSQDPDRTLNVTF
jgi:alkaline phosphatase D